jgi:glycosyltransferase involved in cell wall biosynthesis
VPQPGFNVIGYISANLGLGAAARTTVRLLLENKLPVSVVDIDAGFGRSGKDHSYTHLIKPGGIDAPYQINLIHLNPPELNVLLYERLPWLYDREKMNVIIPFWELPVVPQSWIPVLERMDLILAPTYFIQHMMATQVKGVQVRHYPQTVFMPSGVTQDRKAFGLPENAVLFVTSFEIFSDVNRKNAGAVIEAFMHAFPQNPDVRLVVKLNNPHARFAPQLEALRALVSQDPRIILVEKDLSYSEVLSLYASCDALVSLHRSEGLGLSPMEAMLLGKPVIATGWSGVMDFMTDLNSCLVSYGLVPIPDTSTSAYNIAYVGSRTVWADPSLQSAIEWMRRLANDEALRKRIGGAAAETMKQRHEECRKGDVFRLVERFYENRAQKNVSVPRRASRTGIRRPLRILFQNRINAFDNPGGDTIVMKRLKEQLDRKGVFVDFCGDPGFQNQRSYDLIHLFNLTLPHVTETFAKSAVKQNIPFVITTLQEDFPRYYHKAVAAWSWFKRYVPAQNDRRAALPPLAEVLRAAKPTGLQTSPFAGKAANALCACGEAEAALLRSVFCHDRVAITRFGSSIKDLPAPASLFEQAFGIRDFLLCVGRVEPRKNQLMLLHALEECGEPVVFADGGFTYQQEYLDLCKKFKRKGKTIFTGRLSDELLVSAYRACRLHCLPSWYELPGLVSLEAALYGCSVVASSWGCLPDYLGETCAWCSPEDPKSIYEAALLAYRKPRDDRAQEVARSFTWERFGDTMLAIYDRAIQEHSGFSSDLTQIAERSTEILPLPAFMARITALVEKGQYGDALLFYDEKRSDLEESAPELQAVDGIMERLRKGLRKQ